MSSIAREVEIARHLAERDRMLATPAEEQAREEALRTSILTLWQTYILRRNRPRVIDEVSNALLYYETTFLRTLPQLYAELEDQLRAGDPSWRASFRPSSALGSWIGGDRDGNPFVTAPVLREALRLHSRRAMSFLLQELNALIGELSLDTRLVGASDELLPLGGECGRCRRAPRGGAIPARHRGGDRAAILDRGRAWA